jgi:hypothetical protein
MICTDDGYCGKVNTTSYWKKVVKEVSESFGIKFSGKWTIKDQVAPLSGAIVVAEALNDYTGIDSGTTFREVFGEMTFIRSADRLDYWGLYKQNTITFFAGATQWTTLTAHELGHAFNARIANNGGVTPYTTIAKDGIWVGREQLAGYSSNYTQPGTGTTCGDGTQQCYDKDGNPIPPNNYIRTYDLKFHHGRGDSPGEDFADTFANWATGMFNQDESGRARNLFMITNLEDWVSLSMGNQDEKEILLSAIYPK